MQNVSHKPNYSSKKFIRFWVLLSKINLLYLKSKSNSLFCLPPNKIYLFQIFARVSTMQLPLIIELIQRSKLNLCK